MIVSTPQADNAADVAAKKAAAAATKAIAALKAIKDRATTATDHEKRIAAGIIEKAREGERAVEIIGVNPVLAALIFTMSNSHNRDWNAGKSYDIRDRIARGEWQDNNATVGFYTDGTLGDGQHRFGGIALSEVEDALSIIFVYGMHKTAMPTIDDGNKRSGADAAQAAKITNAKAKEAILKTAAVYLARLGTVIPVRSNTQIAQAISQHDLMLSDAIDVAERSEKGILAPILKQKDAGVVAFLSLFHGWPVEICAGTMHEFQTGHVMEGGENSPLFVAGDYIGRVREKNSKLDKLRVQGELAVVLQAMLLHHKGVKAVRRNEVVGAVRSPPAPNFQPAPLAAE
jgi:hypothetical protein